jgi:collagenase-like PrtC family protease
MFNRSMSISENHKPVELILPTNWDTILIENLSGLPVGEMYGTFGDVPVGNSLTVPEAPQSLSTIKKHLARIFRNGWKFNFFMTSTCLGNQENDLSFRKRLYDSLSRLQDLGIKHITIANPFLLDFISCHHSDLHIALSSTSEITSVPLLTSAKQRGATEITLSPSCNRDFVFLRKAITLDDCTLNLQANQLCLSRCAFKPEHCNDNSHSTPHYDPDDFLLSNCTLSMLAEPHRIIQSPWIRPEDVHTYLALGYTRLVLSTGSSNTHTITELAHAYANETYHGNLLNILARPLAPVSKRRCDHMAGSDLNRLLMVNNDALTDFLSFFNAGNCKGNCGSCTYCSTVAQSSVTSDVAEIPAAVKILHESISATLESQQ